MAYPIDTGRLQARHQLPFRNRVILVELLFESFARILDDVEEDRRLGVSPGVMDNPNRCVATLANRGCQRHFRVADVGNSDHTHDRSLRGERCRVVTRDRSSGQTIG